jgi:hypothetical protein
VDQLQMKSRVFSGKDSASPLTICPRNRVQIAERFEVPTKTASMPSLAAASEMEYAASLEMRQMGTGKPRGA